MFTKNEMWMQKGLIKLVKLYEKYKILDVFIKSRNDILKSWDGLVNLCVELLNICTEFLNICDKHHVIKIITNNYYNKQL